MINNGHWKSNGVWEFQGGMNFQDPLDFQYPTGIPIPHWISNVYWKSHTTLDFQCSIRIPMVWKIPYHIGFPMCYWTYDIFKWEVFLFLGYLSWKITLVLSLSLCKLALLHMFENYFLICSYPLQSTRTQLFLFIKCTPGYQRKYIAT